MGNEIRQGVGKMSVGVVGFEHQGTIERCLGTIPIPMAQPLGDAGGDVSSCQCVVDRQGLLRRFFRLAKRIERRHVRLQRLRSVNKRQARVRERGVWVDIERLLEQDDCRPRALAGAVVKQGIATHGDLVGHQVDAAIGRCWGGCGCGGSRVDRHHGRNRLGSGLIGLWGWVRGFCFRGGTWFYFRKRRRSLTFGNRRPARRGFLGVGYRGLDSTHLLGHGQRLGRLGSRFPHSPPACCS